MVPAEQDPRHRGGGRRRRRRAVGPDHAVARPDGRRRARDGAPRPVAAAPDRRRDDVEAAHRGEDRAAVLAAGRARARRVARRRRSSRRCSIPARRATLDAENRELQDRHARAARRARPQAAAADRARRARTGRRVAFDELATPAFTGVRVVEPSLETLRAVHRLAVLLPHLGAEGQVTRRSSRSPRRSELFDDAQELLDEIVRDGLLTARGVYGFWPASSDGDDIVVHDDNETRFCFLRQQSAYGDSRPNRCLADYVAPAGDHVGAFAVTAGIGLDELSARFEADHDDYRSIMAKALADRLAEAFAEYLHEVARREWYETGPTALARTTDRGALPRHPPGVRLSRLPGSQREGQALRPARRRAGGHLAHGELRDVPGRERQRHLSRASAGALLLRRPGRPRPGRGLRGAQGPAASTRSSAGSGRTSRTSPGSTPPAVAGLELRPGTPVRWPGRSVALFFPHADDAEERHGSRCDPERQRPRGAPAPGARADAPLPAAAAAAAHDGRHGRPGLRLDHARDPRRRLGDRAAGSTSTATRRSARSARTRRARSPRRRTRTCTRSRRRPSPRRRSSSATTHARAPTRRRRRTRAPTRSCSSAPTRRTDTLSLMSFPRDLQVPIYCKGTDVPITTDRINSAWSTCGEQGTLDTVAHLTGLPINYLITVNFHGFKLLVNKLHGVYITVDHRYINTISGPSGYAKIDLHPGYQKLVGQQALDFVRFRHTDSDLYRLARQQLFLDALKDRLASSFSLARDPADHRRGQGQRRGREAGSGRADDQRDPVVCGPRLPPAAGPPRSARRSRTSSTAATRTRRSARTPTRHRRRRCSRSSIPDVTLPSRANGAALGHQVEGAEVEGR